MNTQHTPSLAAASAAVQPLHANIRQLRSAVENMDGLAQEGFSQIAAIAKLALSHMETPHGWQHPEAIAQALEAIQGKAEVQNDCISHEAHEVGCAFADAARLRRFKAIDTRLGVAA